MRPGFMIPFLFILIFSACPVNTDEATRRTGQPLQQPQGFSISNNYFVMNGTNFRVKCIGLEPFMPGESPEKADYPASLNYAYALSNIRLANANTVYLLTGDPANLQPAFFQEARNNGIYIVLGLWFDAYANDYAGHSGDFQDTHFKTHVTNLIRQFIDRFHDLNGTNYSSQILYLVIGNELDSGTITATAAAHPGITSFNGNFIRISNANATECFLAEMMDFIKTYEAAVYSDVHYVSHHTWPVVSPWQIRNDFLDIISYNLYSYWPAFVSGHLPGSGTFTPYQGALEELASYYTNKPFVVSEFGISVAPGNTNVFCTNGAGQSNEIYMRWRDITNANRHIAGCSIHQLFDEWWKDDADGPRPTNDEDEHDPADREEYYGIIGVEGAVGSPVFTGRPALYMMSNMYR